MSRKIGTGAAQFARPDNDDPIYQFPEAGLFEAALLESQQSAGNDRLYAQLADVLRKKIYSREWGARSKIPSEHELMTRYSLSRGTVRHAIDLLIDERLLERHQGKGTFVAERGLSHAVESRPFSFAKALSDQGRPYITVVKDLRVVGAPHSVAVELDLSPRTDVLYLQRVRYVDRKPVITQDSWLNLEECPGLDQSNFTQESLFDAVERCAGRKIKYSRLRYTARIAGKEHAKLLNCKESAAVLVLEQNISLVDRRPIEWGSTWFRPGESVVSDAVQPD